MVYYAGLETMRRLCELAGMGPSEAKKITAHSPRTVVPTLAALAGRSQQEILMQGRWKDAKMPDRYAREKAGLPMRMLRELAADLRNGWNPLNAAPGSVRP